MTGRPLLGLMLALVVEGRHWTRIRWEFDDEACGKAWHLSSIGIVLAAVLIWLDGNRYTALPSLLSWLPALMIPMQFIQSYGMRESMPMSAFSFLARRRRERSLRFGLIDETSSFNFGNAMFAITMVAATVGSKASSNLYLPGLLILGGWMLMSKGHGRPLLLIAVLAVAGLMAMTGRFALERAEEWLGSAGAPPRGNFDPNFVSTLIGTPGAVQQSEDIVWRMKPALKNPPPWLLRTASFNNFLGANWRNQRLDSIDFTDLDTRLIGDVAYYLLGESGETQDPSMLPRFTLRGGASAETPLPLPGDCEMLRDFAIEGIERNTFGTVRVFPKNPVIEGTVFWRGGGNPESPPIDYEDFQIPVSERELIHRTMEEIGIGPDTGLREQLAILRTFFHRDFRYTRNLTIRQPFSRASGPTAISRFLTEARAGHCEYFATSAVLILRAAGIPARYATGYAVMERDVKRGGFVIRGTHGHAWCRVWDKDAGVWIDFDPTPPDWLGSVSGRPRLAQRLNDDLKRLREDFFLWRNKPENRLAVTLTMLAVGTALAAFIVKRLWRSRRRLDAAQRATGYEGPVARTPLHALEPRARMRLGERPPGEPFARWLDRLRPMLANSKCLDEAISLHQRLRFDPALQQPADQERLARLAAELESQLRHV